MTTVGVVSQGLRVPYAVAWLAAQHEPAVLVVAHEDSVNLGDASHIRIVAAGVAAPVSERLAGGSARQWLRHRAHAGSRVALAVERAARRLIRLLRFLARLVNLVRRRQTAESADPAVSAVATSLASVLESDADRIDRIVCFDVCDLPAVLTLADEYGVSVVVR